MRIKDLFKTVWITVVIIISCSAQLFAQIDYDKVFNDSKDAAAAVAKKNASIKKLFNEAAGYIVLPNIKKNNLSGRMEQLYGAVYEKGKTKGFVTMSCNFSHQPDSSQLYCEIIVFEKITELQLFRENRCKSVEHITITSSHPGFPPTVKYANGIVVFLEQLKGLPAPLTVETHAFTYLPLKGG